MNEYEKKCLQMALDLPIDPVLSLLADAVSDSKSDRQRTFWHSVYNQFKEFEDFTSGWLR